jgi:branched-chain amino acid transport system ATP-binding protein
LEAELLSVTDMTVFYRRIIGVTGVSLSVRSGGVLAILGANSSGKSSVLRGIAGAARTTGTVSYLGQDISRRPAHLRSRNGIASVPQGRQVFRDMSVSDNLLVGMRGKGRNSRRAALAEIWDYFPRLYERRSAQAGYLSGGEQQMLAIGRALMSRPRLLLLDEPSLGLAPKMVTAIFDQLSKIAATGVALLVVDQNAVKTVAISDEVCVIRRGEMVYRRTAAEARLDISSLNTYIGLS